MKKNLFAFSLAIAMTITWTIHVNAEKMYQSPQEDSKQLQLQDMLMLFLLPHIEKAVTDYYSNLLIESTTIYPYLADVINVERLNGFRGFDFLITLEVSPVVGPHIGVGKDSMTFQLSSGIPAKLIQFEHQVTYKLPPNWQHIIKRR